MFNWLPIKISLRKKLDGKYKKYEKNPELIFKNKDFSFDIKRYVDTVKDLIEKYSNQELTSEQYQRQRDRASSLLRAIGFNKKHFSLINEKFGLSRLSGRKSKYSYIAASDVFSQLEQKYGNEYVINEEKMSKDPEFSVFYNNLVRNNQNTTWDSFVDRMLSKLKSPSDPEIITREFEKALKEYGDQALNKVFIRNTPYKWIPHAARKYLGRNWESFKNSLDFNPLDFSLDLEEIKTRYINATATICICYNANI
jgi:hypothetical protein